jgi:hypothetical protein
MEAIPDDLRHRVTFSVMAERVAGGALAEQTLLETFDFADALVGVPIGFMNIEHGGLKAVGADITSALAGGTT